MEEERDSGSIAESNDDAADSERQVKLEFKSMTFI